MIIDAILDRMGGIPYNEKETMKYLKEEAKIFKMKDLSKALSSKKNSEIREALITYVRENYKGNAKVIKYLEKTDWVKEMVLDGEMTCWRWDKNDNRFYRLQMIDFAKIYYKGDKKVGTFHWNKIREKLSHIKHPDGSVGCGKYTNYIFGSIKDKKNEEHDIIYRYDKIKSLNNSEDIILSGTWLNEKIVERIGLR